MLKILFHILLYGALFLAFLTPVDAMEDYSEEQLKAATVFNVAKFVKWPESSFAGPKTPLVICVLGETADVAGFAFLEDKLLSQRTIQIKHLTSLHGFIDGQILYLSGSASWDMVQLRAKLQQKPVLTISDAADFASKGGMISLEKAGQTFRFAINLEASTTANLQLSSKLNSLATVVIRDSQ